MKKRATHNIHNIKNVTNKIRRDTYNKTINRTKSKTLRENSFYKLYLIKSTKEYFILDKKSGILSDPIGQEIIKNTEVIIYDNDHFKSNCFKILDSQGKIKVIKEPKKEEVKVVKTEIIEKKENILIKLFGRIKLLSYICNVIKNK